MIAALSGLPDPRVAPRRARRWGDDSVIPDLIYDVGMNNGDDTAYYLHKGYRVVAVEANPRLADDARRRFAPAVESGKLRILNVGIAETAGEQPFWICEAVSDWSSFDRALAARGGAHHSVPVPCRPFADILAEYGVPFYAKVDIEGSDALCLLGLPADDPPAYVSVETTDPALVEMLQERGYGEFQWIHQQHLLPLEWPPAPVHRRFERLFAASRGRLLRSRAARRLGLARWVETRLGRTRTRRGWTFPLGSSGPFGEDLPGRWLGAAEMRATMDRYAAMRAAREPSALWNASGDWFWVDLHGRRAPARGAG